MIGLILLYFIGRRFYELAFEFDKNKWFWAVLGILSYYAGTFLGGMLLGAVAVGFNQPQLLEMQPVLLSLMTLPIGLLTCWILYVILKRQWGKRHFGAPEVIDSDAMN